MFILYALMEWSANESCLVYCYLLCLFVCLLLFVGIWCLPWSIVVYWCVVLFIVVYLLLFDDSSKPKANASYDL